MLSVLLLFFYQKMSTHHVEPEFFEPLDIIQKIRDMEQTINLDYTIDVEIGVESKVISGSVTVKWHNTSNHSVSDLQFHAYLNAFKNEHSAFLGTWGEHDLVEQEDWGYIETSRIEVNGVDLTSSLEILAHPDFPRDETVWRLPLPSPVQPSGEVTCKMAFTAKLPKLLARTGFSDDYFFVGQWFPKLGVWEPVGFRGRKSPGWNCHTFFTTTEFFANFARYDVTIKAPKDWTLGATGVLHKKTDLADGVAYQYVAENVHDFAFTLSPHFKRFQRTFKSSDWIDGSSLAHWAQHLKVAERELDLPDLEMVVLLQPEHEHRLDDHFEALAQAITFFGLKYGPYPYPQITCVDPPRDGLASGGMEYPMIFTAGWDERGHDSDPAGVIIHEFGHQYWYGMIATNEFEEAWLDEGFNTFDTGRLLDKLYPNRSLKFGRPISLQSHWFGVQPWNSPQVWRAALIFDNGSDAVARPSAQYKSMIHYGVNVYYKAAAMLHQLRLLFGETALDQAMRHYFQTWQFNHPTTEDFQKSLESSFQTDLAWFFDQFITGTKTIDFAIGSVDIEDVSKKSGYLEHENGRTFVKSDQTMDNNPLYRSRVRIEQKGTGHFPVQIQCVFENGRTENLEWEDDYPWVQFVFEGPDKIQKVIIDPQNKVFIDMNPHNQIWVGQPDPKPKQRLGATIIFYAQTIVQSLMGGF